MDWRQLINKLMDSAKEKRIPISGSFEITSRCNLSCKMCYINQPANDSKSLNQELSTKEWISLAKEAREAGMFYLLLTGGEVFLRSDFLEIYEEISKLGLLIQIFSNATLITPKIAKRLGQIPPSKVGITIYGASRGTYEKVCGNGNGYDLAVRGIDLLVKEGIKTEIRTTIIQSNIKDFEQLVNFAKNRNLNILSSFYITPRRDDHHSQSKQERLSPEELLQFETLKNQYKIKNVTEKEEMVKVNSVESDLNPSNTLDPFGCGVGKNSFWITWDGSMTPCGNLTTPKTFPLKNGFNKSWIELQKLITLVPNCTECNQCNLKEYCIICPARLKIETGCFDKPAPYLCQIAKLRKVQTDNDKINLK